MRNVNLTLLVALMLGCTGSATVVGGDGQQPTQTGRNISVSSTERHAIMRPDRGALSAWRTEHSAMPKAAMDRGIQKFLLASGDTGTPTSINLLPYMKYPQVQRNQGYCGNCWVFGSTAAAEILMNVHGIGDAVSVQYFNSSYTDAFACCGGSLTTFANWYAAHPMFVSLENANAGFADASSQCGGSTAMAASQIAATPNYSFTTMQPVSIPTTGQGQVASIANIKNLLNQNIPVTYSFFLPSDAAWNDFFNFWNNQPESALWNGDSYSGQEWNSGGGHLVTIVGYDDNDANEANHYWIILNSWGTSANRPNGLFRLAQKINYDSTFTYSGTTYNSNIFESINLVWPASTALAIAVQPQPSTVAIGQPALMKAVVTGGTLPYTFQWRRDGVAIPGANAVSYVIAAASASDQGSYELEVDDAAAASVMSQAATLTVVSCLPSCTGKQCGSDGCGGSCGACADSTTCDSSNHCIGGTCAHPLCSTGSMLAGNCDSCVDNICITDPYCCTTAWDSICVGEVSSICHQSCNTCTPACGGKQCGPDGCGGVCGACADGNTCDANGQCIPICVPACAGKQCGDDGCGGVCGTCADGTTCNSTSGQCVVICKPSCDGKQCGDDGCGGSCGACDASANCDQSGKCVPICVPSCAGKQCGSDGCGGNCGGCGAGTSCNGAGACTSGKLVITQVGTRGATAADEMIELYNGSSQDISLAGYQLNYRAAGTSTKFGTALIKFAATAKVPAGKHFLIAPSSYTGTVTPDASFSAGIADSGSLWLFKGPPTGTGLTRTDANFVDEVGWGTAVAANYEGSGAAPSPAKANQSIARAASGADTDDNKADFVLQPTRTPHNLASP